jgi:BON domain
MARWQEERERWMGRGDPYGEDDRRFRDERWSEGRARGRSLRDEERFPEWRGSERPWERGEREWPSRERWSQEREPREWGSGTRDWGREYETEGGWRETGGREPWGMRGEGRYGERSGGESWRDRDDRSMWGGERWGRGMGREGGERWESGGGGHWGGGGRWEGRGERIPYGTTTYGPSGERQHEGGWGREHDRGPVDKLKEGWRKLTGKGPKGYQRSDERVREDVCERIARSGIDAGNVEVKVERGEVTLTGFVSSREDKRYLEDVADDVCGVDEVHNHVRLRREETSGAGMTAGTSTTGTGAAMSAQPGGTRTGSGQTQQPQGRH